MSRLYAFGQLAARRGDPLSACPYPLGDADGLAWRRGWVNGEWHRRAQTGAVGEPPDRRIAAALLASAEHRPDPCQEVIDNLAELRKAARVARVFALLGVQKTADVTITVNAAADDMARYARDAAEAVALLGRALSGEPEDGRCPTHDVYLHGGGCPRCQREQQRRESRLRR